MNSAQYIKLIIICIFVLFSALSWTYRKFKEQQARQAAKNEALRRREEMLRTGRVDGQAVGLPTASAVVLTPQPTSASVHDEARRRLQELAAQRRRELEAMARRAGGTAAAQPAAAPAGPMSGSKPTARQPQAAARPQPAPRSREQARQQANKAAKAAEVRRQADKQAANRERQQANRREADAEATKADQTAYQAPPAMTAFDAGAAAPAPAAALRALVSGVPSGAQDWRRAIVMLELLGSPVGARDPHQEHRVF